MMKKVRKNGFGREVENLSWMVERCNKTGMNGSCVGVTGRMLEKKVGRIDG